MAHTSWPVTARNCFAKGHTCAFTFDSKEVCTASLFVFNIGAYPQIGYLCRLFLLIGTLDKRCAALVLLWARLTVDVLTFGLAHSPGLRSCSPYSIVALLWMLMFNNGRVTHPHCRQYRARLVRIKNILYFCQQLSEKQNKHVAISEETLADPHLRRKNPNVPCQHHRFPFNI